MRKTGELLTFSATEVGGFLACQHLTTLDLKVAAGELERPGQNDIERRLLEKRGHEHEARVLAYFREQGRQIADLTPPVGELQTQRAAEATLAAMQAGAELIYQGTLITRGWVGRPDFLQRVPGGARWGHHYEPVDAKLARETKVRAVLQLCAYADQLHELSGAFPERFHIIGGGRGDVIQPEPLLTADYQAYFRSVRRRLEAFVAEPGQEPYPEPVEHCGICRFWKRCEERRRKDDHLSLVAGITRRQRDRLSLAGVERLAELGRLDPERKVDGIAPESLERVREQAALQLRGREEGRALYELLDFEAPEVGLSALPKPTPGDLFLDLEGDAFVQGDGLEYLFGLLDFGEPELDFTVRDAPGPARYRAFWAEDRADEKRAFEQVIDRVLLGRQEFPDLHLFHFGHREADALKKLSCRHATREAEIDQLLRDGVLVDLLPIVRHGLRASVESYSLKELERLHGYERQTGLRDAARAMQLLGYWLETGDAEGATPSELRSVVESYNRDDCFSTARLRDFLEALRVKLEQQLGRALPRPIRDSKPDSEELTERQKLTAELGRALTADPAHPEHAARQLLAHLLDFHWREAKSGWWEYHRARELAPAERLDDKSAIAELSHQGEVDKLKQSSVHLYTFPEQEHALRLVPAPCDPETGKPPGEIVELGLHHVKIKRGPRTTAPHPRALIVGKPIDAKPLPDALQAFAQALLSGSEAFAAARSLLLRTPPASAGGRDLARPGEKIEATLSRLAQDLDGSVIAVQGPPGSGKTYQAAQLILDLLRRGKRVGVTANSHAVIKNLLQRVCEQAMAAGTPELVRALHLDSDDDGDKDWAFAIDGDKERVRGQLSTGRLNLVGGTAWTWARADYRGSVDALVIDEAGQTSLANALAVAGAGSALILFGDPAQLEQPQKGVHPPGAEVSALEHWLGGSALTIPKERGVFLPKTRRLHPRICDFISSTFYEGRLTPEAGLGLERQAIVIAGAPASAGLRFVPVEHRGNTNQAAEEVEMVAWIVEQLLDPSSSYTSRSGDVRALSPADILVVTPYNMQVAALRRALPKEVLTGTVDKIQGQEAPVVIYSMTSSSADDAPRGMEFLYNGNRLNVAVSRAQALCIIVASPELGRALCRTPKQLKLANALCAFLEHAGAAERCPS